MTAGWRRFVRSRQSWHHQQQYVPGQRSGSSMTATIAGHFSTYTLLLCYKTFWHPIKWHMELNHLAAYAAAALTNPLIRTLNWAPPTHWHTWTEQSFSTSVQNTSLEQNTKAAQSITIPVKRQINLVLYNWFFIKNMWSNNSWDSWFIQVLIRTGNEPGRGFSHDPVLVTTDSQLLLGII